ncbi:MAG: tight adherence protein B [Paracoccaceae bacterium]|jgi:tight adherence protein B
MLSLAPSIVVFALVTLSAGGLMFALFYRRLAGARTRSRRMAMALEEKAGTTATPGLRRNLSIEHTLSEMAERQKVRFARGHKRPTLTLLLRQGGLDWSLQTYWGMSALIALGAVAAIWLVTGINPALAVALGVAIGLLVPAIYVIYRRNWRLARFADEFPDAVDSIVRGVKAGMPVGDCLRVIATEADEPMRTEFKLVMDNQTLGMPVAEAVERMASRIPLSEARFFAIVITIQARSGGNLAEALDNLSIVLRERKKMHAKIRSMSIEAKTSAWIIGSLPIIVCFFVYIMSPDYITLLFVATIGQIVLAICGIWMLIGVLVMRFMINFDF